MILETLSRIWKDIQKPFFISEDKKLFFREINKIKVFGIENTSPGDVVALIGDFEPKSILTLIKLLEKLKNDEISHKQESLQRFGKLSFLLKVWGNIVEMGSKTAVMISYKI